MMRALAASPLGFVVGLSLGALGSGGSILAVPALVYVAGQTPQQATSTSLVLVALASLAGLPAHLRTGRVKLAAGVAVGATGIGGSFLGAALNRQLAPEVLLAAFSALIALAAYRMLTACPSCTRVGEAEAMASGDGAPLAFGLSLGRIAALLAAGSMVGFLTGLFGVGGGFVVVPMLTPLLGFNMPQAIGTSLVVVAINAAVALVARLGSVHIDVPVTAAFTVAAVLGVVAGGHVADRIDAQRGLRVFAAALVVLAVFTAA